MLDSSRMSLRPHMLPIGAFGVGALVTLLTLATPWVRFAYRSPPLHLVIETTAAVIAALAAYLVFGRFRSSRLSTDLALVYALVLFASANVYVSAVGASPAGAEGDLRTWAAVVTRLIAAAAFAFAAFVPRRRIGRPEGAAIFIATAAVVTFSLAAAILARLDTRLPRALDPDTPPPATADMLVATHPSMLAFQVAAALLFVAAALGFTRGAARTGDELLRWLAAGSMLAAFSAVHYFLFPSLYSEWVYTGDFLRVGFYGLLLVGAAREISSYWRSRADAAVLEERRRLARELHDGLAHELAYIAREAKWLVARGDARAGQLARAAERALDESRRAIAVLTRPLDQPLGPLLVEMAETAAARVGVRLIVDVRPGVFVEPEVRDDLLRITSEAITNAGVHGAATEVRVELLNGDGTCLRIADNGHGFNPAAVSTGFGLSSMRERAESHGGELRVTSRPRRGSEIEVVLP